MRNVGCQHFNTLHYCHHWRLFGFLEDLEMRREERTLPAPALTLLFRHMQRTSSYPTNLIISDQISTNSSIPFTLPVLTGSTLQLGLRATSAHPPFFSSLLWVPGPPRLCQEQHNKPASSWGAPAAPNTHRPLQLIPCANTPAAASETRLPAVGSEDPDTLIRQLKLQSEL